MIVDFNDPVNLNSIYLSKQSFCIDKISNDHFRLYDIDLIQINDTTIDISKDVDRVKYILDYDTKYQVLHDKVENYDNEYMQDMMEFCKGLRILRLPIEEVIVYVLLNRASNNARVQASVDKLRNKFGSKKYPTKHQLKSVTDYQWEHDIGAHKRCHRLYWALRYDEMKELESKYRRLKHKERYLDWIAERYDLGDTVLNRITLNFMHYLNDSYRNKYVNRVLIREFDDTLDLSWCIGYRGLIFYYIQFFEERGYGRFHKEISK